MILLITRDQRTGEAYDPAQDDSRGFIFTNEVPDIEVEVGVGDFYEGSDSKDDPPDVEIGGRGRVVDDVPRLDESGKPTGEFVFRAGQVICLSDEEIEAAREQAFDEARERATPEFSYDE